MKWRIKLHYLVPSSQYPIPSTSPGRDIEVRIRARSTKKIGLQPPGDKFCGLKSTKFMRHRIHPAKAGCFHKKLAAAAEAAARSYVRDGKLKLCPDTPTN
jgi:hypothetical protein